VAPLASHSISLRLYPHLDLPPVTIVDELRAQAARADRAGFDGVMTSEHHGGFAGYLPNPLHAANWCLEAMDDGWAAACPLLLPLRPVALVAEEVAWSAARFPDRVGIGVAAGALTEDFVVAETDTIDLTARFAAGIDRLARLLRGDLDHVLAGDPALAACADRPVPVVSAAASITASRRAATVGAGILVDSLTSVRRARELVDAYRESGGRAACILIRRAWVGSPPRAAIEQQVGVYRGYAPAGARAHWGADEHVAATDAAEVADVLVRALADTGADALNVRVHVPGVEPAAMREQVDVLGADVLPRIRAGAGFA
jgi:alkanesulfonate monooxygenase SsuD/methylene tetrahydromethanopterin reductase-like flavin-dependent oxidoreductase (luciferase family)